jgi:hypothetical protein
MKLGTRLFLTKPLYYFHISFLYLAQISPEAILVEFLMSFGIPKPACVR